MAAGQIKQVASLLLGLNFCMYVIVLGIGSWAMNRAIDHGFIIGISLSLFLSLSVPLICVNVLQLATVIHANAF